MVRGNSIVFESHLISVSHIERLSSMFLFPAEYLQSICSEFRSFLQFGKENGLRIAMMADCPQELRWRILQWPGFMHPQKILTIRQGISRQVSSVGNSNCCGLTSKQSPHYLKQNPQKGPKSGYTQCSPLCSLPEHKKFGVYTWAVHSHFFRHYIRNS